MTSSYLRIAGPKLLIGEGVEEKRFFAALLRHLDRTDVQVEEYGGKDGLSRFLEALPKIPGYSGLAVLGITRDADKSRRDANESVREAIRRAKLEDPDLPEGSRIKRLRIHVFILPDDATDGMLEDLCLQSVGDDAAMPCVDEFLHCVRQRAKRYPSNEAKARVHAWLSSQRVPDKRLGEAAEAGYWRFDHPAFDALKSFIRSL